MERLVERISTYISEHQLVNAKIALALTKGFRTDDYGQSFRFHDEEDLDITNYENSLMSTIMLIDLKLPLSQKEEDILLAATLCHDMGKRTPPAYLLDKEVSNVIQLVTGTSGMTEEEKERYYERICTNKLAVLVELADCGNLVERLHGLSVSAALNHAREIKKYSISVCLFAKQHYPDIQMPVNILMEKIRNLVDVTEIISERYQKREQAYTNELLLLMEENARIRGMIGAFEE